MFKKTLAAAAILGAFAGSAFAADVTLYGVIDTGFNYTHVDQTSAADTDTFQMASGQNSAPRFGLKGTEDLGNGLKVGFNLENSFNSDDGALAKGGRLFHRESLVWVSGAFGEISFGRMGALDSGAGRYNQMGGAAHALSTGWDNIAKTSLVFKGQGDRMDNTVTYQTPKFGGVSVLAQYSFKKDNVADTDGVEGESSSNRYYAVGVKGDFGALSSALVVSSNNVTSWDSKGNKSTYDGDDPLAVSARVSYDFGFIKPMLAAQYYDGDTTSNNVKGYGVTVGAIAPVLGGKLKATVGYGDYDYNYAKDAAENKDTYTAYTFGLGYEYSLSKRTMVYTAAGYSEQKDEYKASAQKADQKTKTTEVMLGLVHTF